MTALKAIARTHAAFYHLALGDHSVDQFVYWADAIDDADTEERRQFCESAIVRIAHEFLANDS